MVTATSLQKKATPTKELVCEHEYGSGAQPCFCTSCRTNDTRDPWPQ